MTEPSGSRRGHRASGASGTSGWAVRGRRWLVALAVITVVVLVAAGLSIALDRGGTGPADTPPSPAASSDFALVTPRPTIATSFPPVASHSPTSNPSPAPTPNRGIKAKRIEIARLGIDLKIVEGDGIDAPRGKAAHYPGSGWPDGGTNIYIYGHAQTGMFLRLWEAKVGDQIVLTLVDGTQRTYVVAKINPRVPWNAIAYLDPTPVEQLTLQTSTSYYPTSPRFIVIAYPTP